MAETNLVRTSIILPEDLLKEFDSLLEEKNYANRSEAIRDLIRDMLLQNKWTRGKKCISVISMVYDHHQRELTEKLTAIQHDFGQGIISSLHVHISHTDCLEVIVVKGERSKVESLASKLIGTRGVKYGTLTVASGITENESHNH